MSSLLKEYDYKKEKNEILNLLNSCEQEMETVLGKLDHFIEASKDLGIPYLYLLIGLKSPKLNINIGSCLISLYFEDREKEKIKQLFSIVFRAFSYNGPPNYSISNPIEKDFLINIENFGEQENEIPREKGNLLENLYFMIASTIELYNSYLEIKEDSPDDIIKIKKQYEECQKEIMNLKNNKDILHLQYNIDFYNDLLSTINLSKLDNKNKNDNNNNIINDSNNEDSLSMSKSFSQHLEKIPLKDRTFFILNEVVSEGENLEIEFKNYRFFSEPNVVIQNNCADKIKKLICGLLNNMGGRIYFGINDEKCVKGNKLTYKQRDELRLELLNLTTYFYPECKSSKLSVHFIPIKDSNNKFLDRYVTKMIVKQGDTDKLYSISDKIYESYKRLQGMVTQLRPEVIANEIYKRKNNPEKPIPEKEFIDPEPEKNVYQRNSINLNESDDYYNNNIYNYNDNNYYMDNHWNKKKKKNKNKHRNNPKELIKIKVQNIDTEAPAFLLKEIFQDSKNLIVDSVFFENNGLSLGYGHIFVKDKKSAKIIINKYNGKDFFSKKIKLYISDE